MHEQLGWLESETSSHQWKNEHFEGSSLSLKQVKKSRLGLEADRDVICLEGSPHIHFGFSVKCALLLGGG